MGKQKQLDGSVVAFKKTKHEDLIEAGKNQKPMPEIYLNPPKQPQGKKAGQLTPEQLEHFFDKVRYEIIRLWNDVCEYKNWSRPISSFIKFTIQLIEKHFQLN